MGQGEISADTRAQMDMQAEGARLQREGQEFQMQMLELQEKMSRQSRAFDIASAMLEKGDKASEKVGDRIAS